MENENSDLIENDAFCNSPRSLPDDFTNCDNSCLSCPCEEDGAKCKKTAHKTLNRAARKFPISFPHLTHKTTSYEKVPKVVLRRLEELPMYAESAHELLTTKSLKLTDGKMPMNKGKSVKSAVCLHCQTCECKNSYCNFADKHSEECNEDKCKDFFDDATLEYVRHNLLQLSSIEGMFPGGPPSAVTFHSTVIAKRRDEKGRVNVLLHWSPEDMVPDSWVAESDMCSNFEKTIPVSKLPPEALQLCSLEALKTSGILPRPGKRKRK